MQWTNLFWIKTINCTYIKILKGSCLINIDDLNNIHHYDVDNSVLI